MCWICGRMVDVKSRESRPLKSEDTPCSATVCPWASYLNSLSLGFGFCKMKIITPSLPPREVYSFSRFFLFWVSAICQHCAHALEDPVLNAVLSDRRRWHVRKDFFLKMQGSPGGSVVKNPPANAGDTGLWDFTYRWASKPMCHNSWALLWSPMATTTEPVYHSCWSLHALEPGLHSKRSHRIEQPAHCNYRVAHLAATREKPVLQQRPRTAKKK